jgi:pyruvate dehydrogenase E2 component (dihydrolipoamide acetyltransferase)
MPSLGADMEAGTLVEWLVKPGDQVKRGDIVAVVETQKGAIEIEIFEAGQVGELLVGLNTKVPVGTPLARIRTESEAQANAAVAAPPRTRQTAPPATAPMEPPSSPPALRETIPRPPPAAPIRGGPGSAGRVRMSPAARRLAELHGVDPSGITGSGPAGAITYADVERRTGEIAAPSKEKRAAGLHLDAMRTAIAAAMARSKREIPHYTPFTS